MSEKYEDMIKDARKEIELADHLLRVTYPLIKEVKFLLSISQHVTKSSRLALLALFEYAKHWKEMAPIPVGNFAVEISMFKNKLQQKYNFDPKYTRLLRKLDEINRFDKESLVRFKRGEKYILASGDYSAMATIDFESIKRYTTVAKSFIKTIEERVEKIPD